MTTLLLVRHGESIGDAISAGRDNYDLGLSEEGRHQARLLADFLTLYSHKVRAVYASTRARALETGKILVNELGVPFIQSPEFQEALLGEWEGKDEREILEKYSEQVKTFYGDPEGFIIPGGEPVRQIKERIEKCLQTILSSESDDTVIVVSHWIIIAFMICIIEKYPLSSFTLFKTNHCGVTAYSGNWPTLQRIDFNKQIELDPKPRREKEYRFLKISFGMAFTCLLGTYFRLNHLSFFDAASITLAVSAMHYFRYLIKYHFLWSQRLPSWSQKHDLINYSIFALGCASILLSHVLPAFLIIWVFIYILILAKENMASKECLFFTAPGMLSVLRQKREKAPLKASFYFALFLTSLIAGPVIIRGNLSVDLIISYILAVFAIWAFSRDIYFYLSSKWWRV